MKGKDMKLKKDPKNAKEISPLNSKTKETKKKAEPSVKSGFYYL